jgi:betaine lipid synthase
MGTIKTYNGRNNFLNTYLIQIPFYVFLGCSRRRDATAALKTFEVDAGNRVGQGKGGLMTPLSPFAMKAEGSPVPDFFSLGPSAMPTPGLIPNEKEGYEQTIHEVGAPLSPFHYQLRKVCRVDERFIVADEQSWRVPYLEEKIHEQFRTHIYGWVGPSIHILSTYQG